MANSYKKESKVVEKEAKDRYIHSILISLWFM